MEINAVSSFDMAKSKTSIVFFMIFWKMCQTTRSLLRFADSAEALTSMTLPNVITPTRPMNIRTISTNLLPMQIDDSMPDESPAVANADVASKTRSRKFSLSPSNNVSR